MNGLSEGNLFLKMNDYPGYLFLQWKIIRKMILYSKSRIIPKAVISC